MRTTIVILVALLPTLALAQSSAFHDAQGREAGTAETKAASGGSACYQVGVPFRGNQD
jgi:hypothetical protein